MEEFYSVPTEVVENGKRVKGILSLYNDRYEFNNMRKSVNWENVSCIKGITRVNYFIFSSKKSHVVLYESKDHGPAFLLDTKKINELIVKIDELSHEKRKLEEKQKREGIEQKHREEVEAKAEETHRKKYITELSEKQQEESELKQYTEALIRCLAEVSERKQEESELKQYTEALVRCLAEVSERKHEESERKQYVEVLVRCLAEVSERKQEESERKQYAEALVRCLAEETERKQHEETETKRFAKVICEQDEEIECVRFEENAYMGLVAKTIENMQACEMEYPIGAEILDLTHNDKSQSGCDADAAETQNIDEWFAVNHDLIITYAEQNDISIYNMDLSAKAFSALRLNQCLWLSQLVLKSKDEINNICFGIQDVAVEISSYTREWLLTHRGIITSNRSICKETDDFQSDTNLKKNIKEEECEQKQNENAEIRYLVEDKNTKTPIERKQYEDTGISPLINVTVLDSKTVIDAYTLNDADFINVVIPHSVTSIAGYAFANCKKIASIVIPDNVTSIGRFAFDGCTSLANMIISESVKYIGDGVFNDCKSLKTVAIPDGVKSMGDNTFENCSSLQSILLPNHLNRIGNSAFYNCNSLNSVEIPDGVTKIGAYAFAGCSSLTSIVIPEGVTKIGAYAFVGCSSLTNVVIPNSVTSIANHAFEDCIQLSNIEIPDGVTSIADHAFSGCSSLTNIVIPNGISEIANSAFAGCNSLTGIIIPDGVKKIGSYVFEGCSNLFDLIIPGSVASIGNCAFAGCSNLSSISIPDNVKSIGEYTFENCRSLINIVIPDGVTEIYENAFAGCSSLSSVIIPDSVSIIGEYAFAGCSNLTRVSIPDSVTVMGESAFADCFNLTLEDYNNIEKSTLKGKNDRLGIIDQYYTSTRPEHYTIMEDAILESSEIQEFSDFSDGGCVVAAFKRIPNHHASKLSVLLKEDFYYMDDIVKIYGENFTNVDAKCINPNSLTSIGFIAYSKYAIKNYPSAEAYFRKLLTKEDIFDISPYRARYKEIMMFYQTVKDLRREHEIFLFEDEQYISFRRLSKAGITKQDIENYCSEVKDAVPLNTYFTIESLRNDGFNHSLDDLGFDDSFYAGILAVSSLFRCQRVFGNSVLYSGDETIQITKNSFIQYLLCQYDEGIELDDFFEDVREKYGISIPDKYAVTGAIAGTEMYYDNIMDKIYPDKEQYYSDLDD